MPLFKFPRVPGRAVRLVKEGAKEKRLRDDWPTLFSSPSLNIYFILLSNYALFFFRIFHSYLYRNSENQSVTLYFKTTAAARTLFVRLNLAMISGNFVR